MKVISIVFFVVVFGGVFHAAAVDPVTGVTGATDSLSGFTDLVSVATALVPLITVLMPLIQIPVLIIPTFNPIINALLPLFKAMVPLINQFVALLTPIVTELVKIAVLLLNNLSGNGASGIGNVSSLLNGVTSGNLLGAATGGSPLSDVSNTVGGLKA